MLTGNFTSKQFKKNQFPRVPLAAPLVPPGLAARIPPAAPWGLPEAPYIPAIAAPRPQYPRANFAKILDGDWDVQTVNSGWCSWPESIDQTHRHAQWSDPTPRPQAHRADMAHIPHQEWESRNTWTESNYRGHSYPVAQPQPHQYWGPSTHDMGGTHPSYHQTRGSNGRRPLPPPPPPALQAMHGPFEPMGTSTPMPSWTWKHWEPPKKYTNLMYNEFGATATIMSAYR